MQLALFLFFLVLVGAGCWFVLHQQTAVSVPIRFVDDVTTFDDVTKPAAAMLADTAGEQPMMNIPPTKLQVDVAFPEQVTVDEPFEVMVLLRSAGDVALTLAEIEQTRQGALPPIEKQAEVFMQLFWRVRSPACDNVGADEQSFRLLVGQRTAVFFFELVARRKGSFAVVLMVGQQSAEALLGGVEVQITAVSEPTASPPQIEQQPLGNAFLPEALSFSQTALLREALLRCGCMSEPQRRQVVVENLPSNVQTKIGRFANPTADINSILATCYGQKTALYHLLEIVRYYEGESEERWGMEAVIAQIYG